MASVWAELQRRNVVRVGVAYAVVAWLLVQIVVSIEAPLNLPEWTDTLIIVALGVGFVVAIFLAWAYELTPSGIKRTKVVPLSDSVARVTGRKLDFVIIGLLLLAVGYMFLDNYVLETPIDVPPVASDSAPASQQRDMRSIAALPFANESAAEENAEFFANGIHDEILTQLAKIGSLKVISRTSVEEYRGSPKNMREIGAELGVATLLEGRVQRAGDMVRINVQLIDAETDEHLWAEIYNRELTAENIFAIQNEMAVAIADALEATLTPREVASLQRAPTDSARAYDFYLSGNDYYTRGDDLTNIPLALQQYQRAVDEDPDFAIAWAALSRSHSLHYWYAIDRTQERLDLALQAVEHAFEIEPDLPEGHIALGSYYYQGFNDYDRALEELALAESAMPNAADVYELRAYIYRRLPDLERSLASFDRAIELSPRSVDLLNQRAGTRMMTRTYAGAERDVERMLEIQPDYNVARFWRAFIPLARDGDPVGIVDEAPNFPIPVRHWMVWLSYLYQRDYAEIREYFDALDLEFMSGGRNIYMPTALARGTANALDGDREAAEADLLTARAQLEAALLDAPEDSRLYAALGQTLAFLGESDAAAEAANRAIELSPVTEDAIDGADFHLDAFRIFAALGDTETAVQHLDAYLNLPGRWSIESLAADPRIDPIRDDPAFQALVERYRRQ